MSSAIIPIRNRCGDYMTAKEFSLLTVFNYLLLLMFSTTTVPVKKKLAS
jgi:hypothetical protein